MVLVSWHLPVGLSELQNEEPLISVSLLDHISCNGGNSLAIGSEGFPVSY